MYHTALVVTCILKASHDLSNPLSVGDFKILVKAFSIKK